MDEEVRAYQRKLQQGEGDLAYYLHLLERSGQAGPFLANNLPSYHATAVRHHLLTQTTVDTSPLGSDKRSPVLATITWLISQKLATRALIVCPAICIPSWEEALKSRDIKFVTVRGPSAALLSDIEILLTHVAKDYFLRDTSVFLTTYETLSKIAPQIVDEVSDPTVCWPMQGPLTWPIIVCDEAHYIKNIRTKRHKAVVDVAKHCKAKWRIALTGCPVTRSLLDIYGLYRFIDPTIFPKSIWDFRAKYMRQSSGHKYAPWEPKPTAFAEISALIQKTMHRSGE